MIQKLFSCSDGIELVSSNIIGYAEKRQTLRCGSAEILAFTNSTTVLNPWMFS